MNQITKELNYFNYDRVLGYYVTVDYDKLDDLDLSWESTVNRCF